MAEKENMPEKTIEAAKKLDGKSFAWGAIVTGLGVGLFYGARAIFRK